eukprot:775553_1
MSTSRNSTNRQMFVYVGGRANTRIRAQSAHTARNGNYASRSARRLCPLDDTGNPTFADETHQALLSLFASKKGNGYCKEMSAQALYTLLTDPCSTRKPNLSYVIPAIALLQQEDLKVQHEGYQIIRFLSKISELQDSILSELTALLYSDVQTNVNDPQKNWKTPRSTKLLPYCPPQACAAKALGLLADRSAALAERMVAGGLLGGVVGCFVNANSFEAQTIAGTTLMTLFQQVPTCKNEIKAFMGVELFELFVADPERFPHELTKERLESLRIHLANSKGYKPENLLEIKKSTPRDRSSRRF